MDAAPVTALGSRATLVDPAAQVAFARDGHVTVPLLDDEAVDELRAVFHDLFPGRATGFVPTAAYATRAQKQATTEVLFERLVPRIAPLFDRHRPFMAAFLVKWPGEAGVVPLHQDDWHVDERRFRAVAVWIALDDVGPEEGNGPLEVVAGSQWVEARPRGTGTPWPYTAECGHLAEHHLVTVPARRGEAVVLDNGVVHGSAPNRTDRPRLAVAIGMAPEEAGLVQAVADDAGQVWLFDVDPDFYVEQDLKAMTVAGLAERHRCRERLPALPPTLSAEEHERLCARGCGTHPGR